MTNGGTHWFGSKKILWDCNYDQLCICMSTSRCLEARQSAFGTRQPSSLNSWMQSASLNLSNHQCNSIWCGKFYSHISGAPISYCHRIFLCSWNILQQNHRHWMNISVFVKCAHKEPLVFSYTCTSSILHKYDDYLKTAKVFLMCAQASFSAVLPLLSVAITSMLGWHSSSWITLPLSRWSGYSNGIA